MSITPNPDANYTPPMKGYSGQGAFRFWCQTVLPIVYDDSLSYYELLNKMVIYLNNTIADVAAMEDNVQALHDAYAELQSYVNHYFDELDVQSEINIKLDAMASSGELDALLEPFVTAQLPDVVDAQIDGVVAQQIDGSVAGQINDVVASQIAQPTATAVTAWLGTHVDPVGSAVIVDDTLTISGAAADSKTVGDEISDLKNTIDTLYYPLDLTSDDVVDGYYINAENGYAVSGSYYKCTDFISLKSAIPFSSLRSVVTFHDYVGCAFYDDNKTFISGIDATTIGADSTVTETIYVTIPENAVYFRATIWGESYSAPNDFNLGVSNVVEDTSGLKRALNNNASGFDTFELYGNFQHYGLNSNGTFKTDQKYRVSNNDPMTFDRDITVYVKSGFQWGYIPFTGTTAGTWSGWKTTPFTIPQGTKFEVQIARTSENQSEIANVPEFLAACTFDTPLKLELNEYSKALKFTPSGHNCTITSKTNEEDISRQGELYHADSITFSVNGNAYTGLSFDLLNPVVGNIITVKGTRNTGNNWAIRIVFYDSSNNAITNVNTAGTELSVAVPTGAKKMNVTLAGCWSTALTSGTNVTFTNVSIKYEQADGEGKNLYKGERIVLTNADTKLNKCDITLWKDFLGSQIAGLADYNLYLNEAMAIYNDYVFLFNGGGGGIVVDYSTKEIVSQFMTTPTEKNHQNSAQFTDIYYDAADDYPLLLISRCGNTDGVTSGYDECLVYRVTQSSSTFTFTLVNSISFDKRTYGTSWSVDNVTGTLYLASTLNGNWSVTTDNPINHWAFKMPSKSSIISGTPIILTDADVIAHVVTYFAVQQGDCANGNIVYMAAHELNGTPIKDAVIQAVDVFKGRIVSKIPLIITNEPEGVAVYDGKLYVTQKVGTDTSGTNPLKIYEISF